MLTEDLLSAEEIDKNIVDNVCKHQSASNINRYYLIRYNSDRTFILKTFDNGLFLGDSFGTYEIVEKDGIGYLDVKYETICESPYLQSRFNSTNKSSVFKTMRNYLGPFAVEKSDRRNSKIVMYKTKYSCESIRVMFMFNEQHFPCHC